MKATVLGTAVLAGVIALPGCDGKSDPADAAAAAANAVREAVNTGLGNSADKYIGTWKSDETFKKDLLTYHNVCTLRINRDKTWRLVQEVQGNILGTTYGTSEESGEWTLYEGGIALMVDSKSAYKCSVNKTETKLYLPTTEGDRTFTRQ